MKFELPILFSGAMVRAIFAELKHITRRVIIPQPGVVPGIGHVSAGGSDNIADWPKECKYQPGMFLWVRETWAPHPDGDGIIYRATDPGWDDEMAGIIWHPSIFMKREHSRISLKVSDVRAERLQNISEEDAKEEGITQRGVWFDAGPDWVGDGVGQTAKEAFEYLWDSINGKRKGCSWKSNPFVWIVTFSFHHYK